MVNVVDVNCVHELSEGRSYLGRKSRIVPRTPARSTHRRLSLEEFELVDCLIIYRSMREIFLSMLEYVVYG